MSRIRSRNPRWWKILALACLTLVGGLGHAPSAGAALRQPALVVGDDRGGQILARMREIGALRQEGRDVRIVGSVCYSACTMLIGLETACVSPYTVFGFHGPSRSGQRLAPGAFERASTLIAAHYPPQIRAWYLKTARHEIDGLLRVSGKDLIALGMRAC
ncbi:hypothetical protein [Palleronia sp. LCG004]|uniref:hypothetical protein n=1 Tax=Palleronia sp. LCG004 TaxID=3079304 RepID=UPI002943AF8B|nr:hypothetical protein [Palleronia sp. LCG004]WOI58390.1 hypothetical protein RVY76_18585 [Palleronia sp. LCG004]